MTESTANTALATLFTVAALLALLRSRDYFSPTKFALLNIGLFFGEIFWREYGGLAQLVVAGMIFLVAISVFSEGTYNNKFISEFLIRFSPNLIAVLAWIYSALSVSLLLVLISYFGGLEGYIRAIKLRVVEMQGLGPITITLSWLPSYNICYLAYGIAGRVRNKLWWGLFFLNALLVITAMAFTGSRTQLLILIVNSVMLVNYLGERKSSIFVLALGIVLIPTAAVLGQLRDTFKYEAGEVSGLLQDGGGIMEPISNSSAFRYGLIGIEEIAQREPNTLSFGTTYITAITNLVPRRLWPNKPKTGGVIFTEEYFPDAWGGYSYATPGLFGEAMLNFGIGGGLVVGMIFWLLILFWTQRAYQKITKLRGSIVRDSGVGYVILYVLLLNAVFAYLIGEFANTTVSLLISKALPVAIIYGTAEIVNRGMRKIKRQSMARIFR